MTIFSVTQRFAGSQIKELKQTLFRVVQNSFASIKSKQINTQSPASGLRLHAGLYQSNVLIISLTTGGPSVK